MAQASNDNGDGFLQGIRVLELADEQGEYCGRLLAGLGADVIKIEPPGGSETRRYGPFYQDEPHPDRSLYFWHYNFGKRGIVLDLGMEDGQRSFRELVKRSDVVLETTPRDDLARLGMEYETLKQINPSAIVSRVSPFGDTGPWADHKGSDLVQLALGGLMMNSGYDPEPSGFYDTPPIAPQMWQAYHIAGEHTAQAILGALYHRGLTGQGQLLSTAVHDGVSKNTENDHPSWVYNHTPYYRQTGRHAGPSIGPFRMGETKDGRWEMPGSGIEVGGGGTFRRLVAFLDRYGLADDLKDPKYEDPAFRGQPWAARHIAGVQQRFIRSFRYPGKWREFQEAGLLWAPVVKPEENLSDPHWQARETFFKVEHPELGKTFDYVGAKWYAPESPWRRGPRAPLLGEHTNEVLKELIPEEPIRAAERRRPPGPSKSSPHGKPLALDGVRVIDFTWWLASGGAGRFLSALGAQVIKVEWKGRWDLRFGTPTPTRAERDQATAPIQGPRSESPNRHGQFNDIHSGKLGISLNMQHPKAKDILARLLKDANAVAEGFTSGVMESWGFGYQRMKELNPSIIYAQQSGLGAHGLYGHYRTTGQVAAGFSGIAEMSGLPEPYPPASIGYSYLDWFGAYNLATGLLAALYRQQMTGKGVHIDSSQTESGIYLNGTTILDYSANGRRWRRYGNRSPYKPAAPHGAYRCQGEDRWLALGCFTEAEWQALVKVLGDPSWANDPRFATLESRLNHQDDLDPLVDKATQAWEPYKLMDALQRMGVPAGVCQNAQDRYEHDPQLRHLQWLTEVPHTELGAWPMKEFPVKLSETPAYIGGITGRGAPCYGEDNDYVYGEILGFSSAEIDELRRQEVV